MLPSLISFGFFPYAIVVVLLLLKNEWITCKTYSKLRICGLSRSIFWNWYHQKIMFFQILFDDKISFIFLIKNLPFIIFCPNDDGSMTTYFYEFASEVLHIVIFENFVKLMKSSLSESKFTPNFCFAFKIPDDVTYK